MGIEKNSCKVSRVDPEYYSPQSRGIVMSSDDDDFQRQNSVSAVESDDDDEFDDCDSGAGSDDFDLLELGETGDEFCQVGDQTCSIPYNLYDLRGLQDVLSMEVWNDVLTEEERFSLAKYLPDMDQENFVRTLKELFTGCNLHFGSPVDKLFEMLKGGLCEPRVALYRQGLSFFQRRQHYHKLRRHHNAMVNNICQIRDAWLNCKGYSIEEKLRVLNIMKSQKSLMNENMEELGSEPSDREDSGDGLWGKKGKDQKLVQKTGRYSGFGRVPASDFSSRGRKIAMEPAKHGKHKAKGTLKLADSKSTSTRALETQFPSSHHGLEMKLGQYVPPVPPSRHNKAASFESLVATRVSPQIMEDDDEEEEMFEVSVQRDRNFSRVGATDKAGTSKLGKKRENPRTEEYTDSFSGLPMSSKNDLHAFGGNKTINQLSDIKVLTTKPVNARTAHDYGNKIRYTDNVQQFSGENQMKFSKGQKSNLSLKGSQVELLDGSEQLWLSKQHGMPIPTGLSYKLGDMYAKNKKWITGRDSVDMKASDKLLQAKHRGKLLKEKFQVSSMLNGGRDVAGNIGFRTFPRGEETESDSSENIDDVDEDQDGNPLISRRWAYPGGTKELKYGPDMKKAKFSKKDKRDRNPTLDGSSHSSRKLEDSGEHLWMMKAEQKGKMHDVGHLNIFSTKDLDKNYFPEAGRLTGRDDWQHSCKSARNDYIDGEDGERFRMPALKSSFTAERMQKDEAGHDLGVPQSNYMQERDLENDDLLWTRPLAADNGVPFKLEKKGQMVEPHAGDQEKSDVLPGRNTLSKKRKTKDDLTYMDMRDSNQYIYSNTRLQLDGTSYLKKRGKSKLENVAGALEKVVTETPVTDMQMEDVETESKPQKKPFILITPTVLTGFSFSIVHLLSAVRTAMITMLPEDSAEASKHLDKNDPREAIKEEQDSKHEDADMVHSNANLDDNISVPSAQTYVPSLTVQEIVNRVRSNPGDPCILETQEPLQDLVRGVLKIFTSRTAPLGAKGWKPLVVYQKVVYQKYTKTWSWIGPASHNSSDRDAVEEVTSPDVWGLPHKMLVKLVDSFANWLKNSQDTLQQIGSLPAPPLTLLQSSLDEKERFKDLRAQKSLITINPSSDEIRAYFRKEEVLRYLIPDRAFSYTAVDGKKSIVAPLRRCGGKPTSKARDHFMLKRDRPPHVTILCLVRDAAARLPGSIGTRADVCTLIRDSQYIVEDVSDAQVNQVVSGALDRLHYERDPCVQFDGERKLWVYLHREREEEDFEDDGTSSTKKWRRQKKEATEPSDQGDVTIAYPGSAEQPGFDLVSDLNVETSCADNDKALELIYPNGNDQVDNVETSHGSEHVDLLHGPPPPLILNGLGVNSKQDNTLLCQENSTNEDFGVDPFGGETPA